MSNEDDDDFDETIRGMRALSESGSHGDSRMLLKTAKGIEGLKEKQAEFSTRLALVEQDLRNHKAVNTPEKHALAMQKEIGPVVKDVARIEKWLYAVAAAVGMEALHVLVQLLGGKPT